MKCAEYRESVLADPNDSSPALREHRAGCAECSLYSERLLQFESKLARALRVDVTPRRRAPRVRWLAMAASLLLAVGIAGALWLAAPVSSLAADVVTHMAEEPDAWRRSDVPVKTASLDAVLDEAHVRLAGGAGLVSYANSCLFRGHQVPHLVLQTESGPVTVMVLVHEPSAATVRFDEHGYQGVIVPVAGHGSLAVLTRGGADLESVQRIAARVLDSIVWTS